MFAGKKSAQIREILINESAWEEMTCLFALSLVLMLKNNISFRMLMEEKIRRAAETGNLYIKIDEIYPNISK